MTTLTPGANAPLTDPQCSARVDLSAAPNAEISAFLLGDNGQVRSNADLLCAAQPQAGGAATLDNTARTLQLNLAALDANVAKVLLAVSRQNNALLSDLPGIDITVTSGASTLQANVPCAALNLSSLIAVEFYRRNDQWKLRCVGQGYQGGLAQLAQSHGATVPTAPAAAPTPAPAPAAAPPPPPPPPAPVAAPAPAANTSLSGNPLPPVAEAPPAAPQPAAPTEGGQTAADGNDRAAQMREQAKVAGQKMQEGSKKAMSWLRDSTGSVRKKLSEESRKFRHRSYMEAVVAGCALVSAADGSIDAEEKQKMIGYFQHSEELAVFELDAVIEFFSSICSKFEFDRTIGEGEALRVIHKIKSSPDQARLMIRVCCAIGAADGDFDANERAAVARICAELDQDPADFEL